MIKLTLTGEVPTKKNNYRISKNGGFYKPKKITDWTEYALWEIKKQKIPKIAGKLTVRIIFYMKRDRDIDNAITSIFDLLQESGVIDNDKNIFSIEAIKQKTNEPKTEIQIDLL